MRNDFPPFVFRNSEGKLQGMLVDEWRMWESQTGIHAEIHALDYDEALRRMQAGEFDVIDTVYKTRDRAAYWDFSKPYARINLPIFFRKDVTGITGLKSLKGFSVAARAGGLGADLLQQSGITTVLLFTNYQAMVKAASEHRVNVFVAVEPPVLYFLHRLGIKGEFRQSDPVSVGMLSRAVRKGDLALLNTIEDGFAALNPAEVEQVEEKWYGKVVGGPPALRYLGYAAAAALLVLLALVFRNLVLNRLVARRTADLRRTNRTLRMITECNEALVRATDETELLQAVCRLLVEAGGYRMAWVGFAERDAAKSVRTAARAGVEDGYLEVANITWSDTEQGRGPTGTAIRTGQPVVVRNLLTDQGFAPWRRAALERGYAAAATFPLKSEDRVLGALMVYAAEPNTFETGEVELLGQLAGDLAYGITALRTRVEHGRAEAARQAAHQRLVNIIEFLPDATFVIDQDNRLIAWNRACETMTGVKKEALLGRGDYAYAEPFYKQRRPMLIDLVRQSSPEAEAVVGAFQRSGDMLSAEGFMPWLREGRGAHLWGAAAPLYDPEGRPCGAIEVIRDVTPLKEAEEALHQSEQQFRLIMENLADLVAVLDLDGNRIYNSPSYRGILGDPEQLRGTYSFVEVHPDDRARVEQAFRETVRTGLGQRLEYRMIGQDGQVRHIESQGSVIHDEQGRVARMIVVSRDVTNRKRAEEELHRLSAHLLQVRDLERRHLARELHDTTAQHLAALSLNLAQLRRNLPSTSPAAQTQCAECLELAHQAAQEIRTHSYLLHPPLLEVMGLAEAVEDYAQGVTARCGIQVELATSPDFGRLPADMELALFRVMQECLANVLKHSRSPRAKIRLTRQASLIKLEVQDMGQGIPVDKLARLKARSGGLGVGLGGMHERVSLLGGRLDLESGPTGTTVCATVPLAMSPPEAHP
ncbi:MAG TPA: transporter substrate-binding domain-containing protein [Candidatus Paceibacterota bacterium]|nr:transporter substrate-binding domain-containing protein [Verrucomicrobiota bacterium]HSA09590.1 transporter substrate-binding domain-containing protein [Candidatus Paceibacterota bacterium]